jgi:hypothetical protein
VVASRGGAGFSAFVLTGPGAKPVGTALFQELKWPGRGVNKCINLVSKIIESRAIPLIPLWPFISGYMVKLTNFVFSVPCILNQLPQYKLKKNALYSNIYPTKCNVTQFIYIWKLLNMFRVCASTHHQKRIQLYLHM